MAQLMATGDDRTTMTHLLFTFFHPDPILGLVTRFSAATYYYGFFGYVRKEARLRVR